MRDTFARRGIQPWSAYLLCGALALCCYFLLPVAARNVAHTAIGLLATVAMIAGVRRNRPAHRLPWLILIVGNTIAVAGELAWIYDENALGIVSPFPPAADFLYLSGSGIVAVAVVILIRRHSGGERGAALIDTAIVASGAGVVIGVLLIAPPLLDAGRPLAERLVAGAYPLIALVSLALALRLILGFSRLTPSLWLLVASLAASFITDLLYVLAVAQNTYQIGRWLAGGWLLVSILRGTLVLHPSLREVPIRAGEAIELPAWRLALLAVAALAGPVLLVFQAVRGAATNIPVIALVSALLFLLALGRLRLLAVELHRRESRFRALIQRSTDGIAITDAAGRVRYNSPAARAIIGLDPAELVGTSIFVRLRPRDRGRVASLFAELIAIPNATRSCTVQLRHANGTLRAIEIHGTNLLDEPGINGIVINYRDITARREAEAALHEREERFSLVARATNDAIWDWDLATDACWWSQAIQEILAYAPEEIGPAIDWWEGQIHPAERGAVVADIRAALAGDAEHWTGEYRLRRADGGYALVLDRGFILRDEAGRAVRMLGSVQDVSAQKRAEAEARRQARELALLDRVRTTLARELDLPAILDALVIAAAAAFDTVSVGVLLVEGERLVGRAHVDLANHPLSLHLSEGIAGRCARTGVPLLIPDVSAEPSFIGDPGQVGSEICVPLRNEGRVLGVLNVERETDPALDSADLALLTALGEQASIAIGRARLHAALAASEARHRAVVDTALDAIITTSAGGAIESFNQGAERIFGYPAEEAVGQPLEILLPRRTRERYQSGLGHHLMTMPPDHLSGRPLEMTGRHKDGREFPAEVVLARVAIEGEQFFTGIVRDISERRAYEDRLQHQAHHDPLTGLPNRALFLDRLNGALSRARRDERQRAVLFIDLDRFKDVNDSWGHDAGDRLLIAVTARLRACLRDEDTLARQGGDEFTILLETVADAAETARIADRLAAALDRPFPIAGQEHRITASIGIVMTQGSHLRAEDLLRDADIAMYRAKEAGKARYAIFDPAMQADLLNRLELERELRQALQAERLILHYQPIVDLATREIIKVEALARWPHQQHGCIPPATFIPIAEESGLIRPLGRWVLREASRQARRWEEAGTPVAVAVNLTAHEFQGATLIDEVTGALAATGLAPEHLMLEITESVAMRDVDATTATVAALRRHGVRVAIDDFGTGYSSLAYLKRLPVDTLKIDRAFIDGLGEDPEDTAIVEAIITLAHTLGLQVVAEGVETAAQAAQLRALGCESAQGYLFARPLPAAELGALLRPDRLTTQPLALTTSG